MKFLKARNQNSPNVTDSFKNSSTGPTWDEFAKSKHKQKSKFENSIVALTKVASKALVSLTTETVSPPATAANSTTDNSICPELFLSIKFLNN